MKRLLLLFVSQVVLVFAQSQPIQVPPPTSPAVTVTNRGTAGFNTVYYLVVAHFPAGTTQSSIVTLPTSNATLDSTNYNQVGWQTITGALNYDVLKFSTNAFTGTCTCSLTLATSSTTYSDQGGALSSYTISAAAPAAISQWYLDNTNFGFPKLRLTIGTNPGTIADHLAEVPSGTTLPSYCYLGDIFIKTSAPSAGEYVCGPLVNQWTANNAGTIGSSETETAVSITDGNFKAVGTGATLPAGVLNTVGKTLTVEAYGVYTNAAASLLNANVSFCSIAGCATGTVFAPAGCTVVTTNQANNLTAGQWHLHCTLITHATGATGTLNAKSTLCANLGATTAAIVSCFDDTSTAVSTTADLTAAWFVTPLFKFTTANAGNTATAQTLTTTLLN